MASIGQTITGPRFHETDEVRLVSTCRTQPNIFCSVVRQTKGVFRQPRVSASWPGESHRDCREATFW